MLRQIGVRLNKHEAKAIEELAKAQDVSVSELVRRWLEQAVREASVAR
jgi:predicted HicB family RNase H-like nuclease